MNKKGVVDVDDKQCLNELALFAGAGGGILGGHLLGWRTVCAVEQNQYAASVLVARQSDGTLPTFPIWDDVCTFDGRPWHGIVDVISGGFPCQDISAAGKGVGITGERSGLWKEFARIIGEVRPRYVFVENSPMLVNRGLGTVLRDLFALGFDAEWGVVSAADVGAPHERERIWIVAQRRDVLPHSNHQGARRREQFEACAKKAESCIVANVDGKERARLRIREETEKSIKRMHTKSDGWNEWRDTELEVGRMAHGVAHRVDRIKALGNGQVPAVAAKAWTELINRLENE